MTTRVSSGVRRRAAAVLLATAVIWPPVQMALVAYRDINSWRFGAWGMYSIPRNQYKLSVSSPHGPLMPKTDLVLRENRKFHSLREQFGRFAAPDGLAGALFEENPVIDRLEIAIVRRRFDVSEANWKVDVQDVYRYAR